MHTLSVILSLYASLWPVWVLAAGALTFAAVYDWSNGR